MFVFLFPFFLAELVLKIVGSIVLMGWTEFQTWLPFLASLLVAAMIVGTQFWQHVPVFQSTHTNSSSEISKMALDREISYWKTVLQQQSTDRDVLVNLAELYKAEGDQQKATSYLDAAKKVDPNHGF